MIVCKGKTEVIIGDYFGSLIIGINWLVLNYF